MFRIEIDSTNGSAVQILQKAYKNSLGEVIVLDDGESPPIGFVEFTPEPGPTYKQALDALNATYQADIAKLNNAFALTLLADGPTEATKMAAIRAQYETRKTQHTANIAALKLEYGV